MAAVSLHAQTGNGAAVSLFLVDEISGQSHKFFAIIDNLCQAASRSVHYGEVYIGDLYAEKSSLLEDLPELLTRFVIYAPAIIGLFALTIVIWAIIKWIKLNKK